MMLALLLLIAATQGFPEEQSSNWVDRLVAGEDVSAEIKALGTSAIKRLSVRRAEPRVRDLIRSLREGAASEEDRKLSTHLAGRTATLDGRKITFGQAVGALSCDPVRFAIDPRELQVIFEAEVVPPKSGNSLEILEEICAQTGTDFAFLYGIVLVARPDRLWPAPPPPEKPLPDDVKARAKDLIARLGSESPEDRDRAAAELKKLGPPVLPVLEAGAKDRALARVGQATPRRRHHRLHRGAKE